MPMSDFTSLIPFAREIVILGGAIITIQRIHANSRKERDVESAKTVQVAKEEMAILEAKLEGKINSLKAQVKNLESNVNKDLEHLKEVHSSEIKVLAGKIEELRDELRAQHVGILNLLNKLVDKS
jgi:sensor domain CHASE-containing protein